MSPEFSQNMPQAEVPSDAERLISEAELLTRFGLSAEEASQEVSFMNHTGTVASMVTDEKCPVGNLIEQRKQEEGIEGVQKVFQQLGEMSMGGVQVTVSEKTEDQLAQARDTYETEKKN